MLREWNLIIELEKTKPIVLYPKPVLYLYFTFFSSFIIFISCCKIEQTKIWGAKEKCSYYQIMSTMFSNRVGRNFHNLLSIDNSICIVSSRPKLNWIWRLSDLWIDFLSFKTRIFCFYLIQSAILDRWLSQFLRFLFTFCSPNRIFWPLHFKL